MNVKYDPILGKLCEKDETSGSADINVEIVTEKDIDQLFLTNFK